MRHHQPPSSIGRYQILRPIGEGGMGEVFLAQDPHIDRPLAIKTVRLSGVSRDTEEHKQRLLREAKAAGRLIHPNVVTLFDADEIDGMLFLAFEFVDGPDLGRRIGDPPPLTMGQVLQLLTEVASALDYAHHEGIIHRDIKPSNILIGSRGQAKVADFGLAKLKDESVELTRTGSVVGSPQYMSPEQVRGEALDGRTDIFSLGVLAYELLTRLRPFGGQTISTLVFEILSKEPMSIGQLRPGLPVRLTALVHRMLAKDPTYRVMTAREVIDEIGGVIQETPQDLLDAPAVPTVDEAAPTARLGSTPVSVPAAVVPPPIPGPSGAQSGAAHTTSSVPAPAATPTVGLPAGTGFPDGTGFQTGPGFPPAPSSASAAAPPPSPAQPLVPQPALPTDAIGSQPVGTGTYATRGSRSWGMALGLVLGLLALVVVAGGAWWLGSRGSAGEIVDPSPSENTASQPDQISSTDALADPGPPAVDRASEPIPPDHAPAKEPLASSPLVSSSASPSSLPIQSPPPQEEPSQGAVPSPSVSEAPPTRAPAPTPRPTSSPAQAITQSRADPPPAALESSPPTEPRLVPPNQSESSAPASPWLAEFDALARGASQQIAGGRFFNFDIEPSTAIIRVWRRGDRRQRVMGQAEDYAPKGKNARPLEVPESGDYLFTLVVDGFPNLVIQAEVEDKGSTTRLIRHRFVAGAGAGGDRLRVGRSISFDGTPGDAQVVVDGIPRGRASRWPGGLSSSSQKNLKLRPGLHIITIEAPGYKPFRIEVEVSRKAPRKSQSIRYQLRR